MKKICQLAVMAAMLGGSSPAMSAGLGSLKDGPLPPPLLWTGYYLGVNVGYGVGSTHEDINGVNNDGVWATAYGLVDQAAFSNVDTAGFLGGLQGGYNWQINRTVLGGEIDIAWANVSGSESVASAPFIVMPVLVGALDAAPFFDTLLTSVEQNIEWTSTFRLRAGYLVAPNMLLYLTGGLALAETTVALAVRAVNDGGIACEASNICSRGSTSGISVGYAIGGGVEYMVSPGVSLKGEYLFTDMGSRSATTADMGLYAFSGNPVLFKNEAEYITNVFRVGLNFKLNKGQYVAPLK